MNIKEKEEFAVMKNEISHIKTDLAELKINNEHNFQELKSLLKEHVSWEEVKYKELDGKFASKLTERIVYGLVGIVLTMVVSALLYVVI
jgi:uncharacterized protein YqiB (DUF1249 family)